MDIKLYNTLNKQTEVFVPINKDSVSLYTCGPTVYNFPHIGNYRSFIFGDILKRVLLINNYKVKHIMNITDVDDKTIRDSQKNNMSLASFTDIYTKEFYTDRDALNIIPADFYPAASDYIKEMLDIIIILVDKGFAYVTDDGSVYFDISKKSDYGKLSHIDLNMLKKNASGRLKSDEYDKENISDFALWKSYDNTDGDVFWTPKDILGIDTPIARGRPGWHIECSAMSRVTLGDTIDIHTGGIDNMFPHHENEIAQSESCTGVDFVHYWMHSAWLLVDGKKMSKSANNFYTLRDIIKLGYDPISFRYLTLSTHYLTPLNFTLESIAGAKTALAKLHNFISSIKENGNIDESYRQKFISMINNDLGIPAALGLLWTLVSDKEIPDKDKKTTILYFDEIFGLGLSIIKEKNNIEIPPHIQDLLNARTIARTEKNWALSDTIRDQMYELGFQVKDTDLGQEIKPI